MSLRSKKVTIHFKDRSQHFNNSITAYKTLTKELSKNSDSLIRISHHGYGTLSMHELLHFSRIEQQEKAHQRW